MESKIHWKCADEHDGRDTAYTLFGVNIRYVKCKVMSPREFFDAKIDNHPVRKIYVERAEEVYSKQRDIDTVRHFVATRDSVHSPMAFQHKSGELTILDGCHRITAAFIRNSNITLAIYAAI